MLKMLSITYDACMQKSASKSSYVLSRDMNISESISENFTVLE